MRHIWIVVLRSPEKGEGAYVEITGGNSVDLGEVEMWKLKACPRCEGDVFIDKDKEHDTWYEQCLQCGYQRALRVMREFEAPPESEKDPVLAKGRRPIKK